MPMSRTDLRPSQAPRESLLKRFLPGGRGSSAVRQHLHPDVLDLRDPGPRQPALEDLAGRVERLELGLDLMATTMRRALTRLADQAISSSEETERMVALALAPLSGAVADLSEQVLRIPLALADAAGRRAGEATVPEASSSTVDRNLPATPFDLEPVDEELDALTMLRRLRFAGEDPDELAEAGG